jgi:SNF2 family DNA or RNA helicase
LSGSCRKKSINGAKSTLSKEQVVLYKQMKDLALAQLEQGKLATTASVLTQIMRLQQICCGHLQPDEGPIQEIKNNRLDELNGRC